MMGIGRRRLGRFGIGQGLASVAVIAILAASPALVSVVGSHMDGTGLVIAEAVFGGPVTAQQPPAGSYKECVDHAYAALAKCRDSTPWYSEFKCWIALELRVMACEIENLG